jgi:SAM-dependent methyltransferase
VPVDSRAPAARYYDLNPADKPDDIEFYRNLIVSPAARVLELGCGTGRVLVPLARSCAYVHGVELSPSMLAICHRAMSDGRLTEDRAVATLGDICDFDLRQRFDLIIAPYRVMQNLETDEQVARLMCCIRRHMAPGGSCVLNVFNPKSDRDTLRRDWCREGEMFRWEKEVDGGRVRHYERYGRMDRDRLILYPELIYRRYEGDRLIDEAVLKIAMRCWYPDEFQHLIVSHGFRITGSWGGYRGEAWGSGSELVAQFGD